MAEYESKIEFYGSEGSMKRGIAKEQRRGWEVVSTEAVEQGYGWCLFLPLALLGKKPSRYKVQYRRYKFSEGIE